MSKIEELIQKYCPDGVEWKKVSEIADTFIGLATSVTKHKVSNGVLLLHNSDIQEGKIVIKKEEYLNPDFVQKNKSKILHTDDVITVHTGDVGTSAVIQEDYDGAIGFTTISSRIKDKSIISPRFLCVFLNSKSCKDEIAAKTISDRSNLNLTSFDELLIPLPPIPVQEEILNILDSCSQLQVELQAELQAELQKRQQQYNYYRDYLLSFEGRDDVQWKSVSSVAQVCRGVRVVKNQLSNEGYPVYQNSLTPMGYFDKTNCPGGTTFVICGGAAGNVGYTDVDCWAADDCEYILASTEVCSRYIYHCFMNKKSYLVSNVRKASIPRLSPNVIKEMEIPIPSIAEQEKIASILDRLTPLTNEIAVGISAEIEKRRQQYEFYRDKLLTFKRKEA